MRECEHLANTEQETFQYLQFGYFRPNFMVVLLKDIAIIKAAMRRHHHQITLMGFLSGLFIIGSTVFGNLV